MESSQPRTKERLPELDLLRFAAAVVVVIYHWTYLPIVNGKADAATFGALQAVSRYGYLGVDLFFMISGFVILWSASDRSPASFMASRFSRLYPTFWVCLLLTVATLLLSGRAPASLDISSFLIHLTMIPGPFGKPYLDEVYWTLFVELKFYLLVSVAIWLLPRRLIEPALYVWLAASLITFLSLKAGLASLPLSILKSVTIVPFSQLFIAGAMFYLVWRGGLTGRRLTALTVCLAMAALNAVDQEKAFTQDFNVTTQVITLCAVVALFVAFYAVATKAWRLPPSPLWHQVGALTYPLYLLHHEIGKSIWTVAGDGQSPWLRLLIVAASVALITWLVTFWIERRWPPRVNAFLQSKLARRPLPVQ